MDISAWSRSYATVGLSAQELETINSALNEICNGIEIEDAEFSTHVGVDRDEARWLLRQVHDLLGEMRAGTAQSR